MLHPGVGLAALVACAPALHPWIAEVFYDAVGDDTGREFVELYNPHAVSRSLAGARLEAGDGSGPKRWSVRWTGAAADTVAAGARFVVGGPLVEPAPHAIAALDLQNGPDAVRMVWPDGAVEVVGYGVHEFPEYACASPAVDVPAGLSLARVPDDSNAGSNALDFRAATPTPGRANRPRRNAALSPRSLRVEPERPEPGAPALLSGALENRGAESLAPGEARVVVYQGGAAGAPEVAAATLERGVAPGETLGFALRLPGLGAGKALLIARVQIERDESPGDDRDSLWVRIGPGPLEVTEIQFHPTEGGGEWVEVRNRATEPLEIAGFRIADRRDAPAVPGGGSGPLERDSLALLVQDRPAFLARHPDLDSLRIWEARPWPTLNNHDDASGSADAVVLREPDRALSDRVDYSAAGVPAGVPIERRWDGTWGPAADPRGSPLRPPRAPPAISGTLEVAPRRLAVGRGPASLRWSLPWERASVALDLYDLGGRPRQRLLLMEARPGRGEWLWSPRDLIPGLYLVVLRARGSDGEIVTAARPVLLEGER